MTLSIQAAAEASGLSADTIRYYERQAVLPRVPRGTNGYRSYPQEHLGTLRFARRLRELGLPPDAMRPLIELFHDGTCREFHDALVERCQTALAKVQAQRLELERVQDQLSAVLDGLIREPVDDRPLSTLAPCVCVALVEEGARAHV
jgi:DNA-binding transcriptional MerR regulator